MPGYVLHLTAARMYINQLPPTDPLKYDPKLQNEFFAGNLLPDTAENKAKSHFRDPDYHHCLIEWPHPKKFQEKYNLLMPNLLCQGYYFHLYIDKVFLKDYLPHVVAYYDKTGKPTELRSDADHVVLKKSNREIPLSLYLSDEYYYGDYTRMTAFLIEQFHLPEKLAPIQNPGIQEVNCESLSRIMDELEHYKAIPASAVKNLKVFEIDHLLAFFKQCCTSFYKTFYINSKSSDQNRIA